MKKDVKNNLIYISKQDVVTRDRNEFLVGKFNWILGKPSEKQNLKVKIRHGANSYDYTINWLNESVLSVKLDKSDNGIAPGQFAVFYDDNVCLGGGVILEDID